MRAVYMTTAPLLYAIRKKGENTPAVRHGHTARVSNTNKKTAYSDRYLKKKFKKVWYRNYQYLDNLSAGFADTRFAAAVSADRQSVYSDYNSPLDPK